jgi:phosphotransferase system IIB component
MTETQTIALIIAAAVLVSLVLTVLVIRARRSKKTQRNAQPQAFDAGRLIEALGGGRNIESARADAQRLKVVLADPALIRRDLLKESGLPAVISGRELKLLVKGDTKAAAKSLNQERNGEHEQ